MNQKIKISQLPAKGSNLAAADLIEIAEFTGTGYISKSITGQEIIDAAVGNVDWGDIGGTLSNQTDLQNALDAKVPTSRTLTINGVTQDLSADRTFTISTGITIGSTAITSGTVGRVLFQGTGNVVQQSSSLFWDNTGFLGIGTSTPVAPSTYNGITINSATAGSYVWFQTGGVTKYTVGSESNVNYHNLVAGTSFLIRSGGSSYFNVVQSTGNVQIGTTTDAGFRLDVNGTTAFRDAATFSNAGDRGRITWGGGYFTMQSLSTQGISLMLPSGTRALSIPQATGNVLINTTTDAGFRLDVNGTARVSGNLTLGAEVFGTTNTYFNGPSVNTGTLWLRFNAVNSNGNFTASGIVQGNGVSASGTNSQLSSTGAGVQGVVISNTATSTNWRIEGHRTTSGALEFKNDLTNPVLNLFSSRNVGIGTFTDIASAKLIIESTTQGFLPPRMTTTQKNAIATPAAGLMVYDTTLNVISYYNGSMWI